MDCRKLAWAAVGVAGVLAGCARNRGPEPFVPPQPPKVVATPPPAAQPVAVSRRDRDKDKLESTVLDAKPQNCVRIGDFHASVATSDDPTRVTNPGEREHLAKMAKQAYNRALQIDPNYLPAHLALGALGEKTGQLDDATAGYRAALKIDPNHVPAITGVARVQEAAGDRAAALATLQAATQAQPKEPGLWYEYGLCLGRAKQFDAALASLQRAAELRPKNDDYNKAVGFMLARMGRPDEALAWLAKAMKEADARYNLARMMEHIGRGGDSQHQLAVALKADPNHLPALKMLGDATPLTPTAGPPASPPPAAPTLTIQTASFQPGDSAPAAPLPERPAAAARPRPQMPLMPVASTGWDGRPGPAPSLSSPAPPAPAAPKPRPPAAVGFEPNP